MAREVPLRAEELLQHTAWVRALALRLLDDRESADDIVQETWLATLRRPPRDRESLRPWLAAVVHNLARLRRRSDRRRLARERASAAGEAVPSTERLVEFEAERRRLVEGVLRLREPYRSAVLQRYWQGLSPAEIARRHGVPSSTVRSRLERAHRQLRADLERRTGDARGTLRSLLVLFPSTFADQGRGAVSMGVPLLMSKAKVASVVAVVIVLSSVALWRSDAKLGRDPSPTRQTVSTPALAEVPARVDGVRVVVPAENPAPVAQELDEPVATGAVEGSVYDREGTPLDDARVVFRREGETTRHLRTWSEADFQLEGLSQGAWRVLCTKPGYLRVERTVEIGPGRQRCDFVLGEELCLTVRWCDASGALLAPALERHIQELLPGQSQERATSLFGDLFALATREPPLPTVEARDPQQRIGVSTFQLPGVSDLDDIGGRLHCEIEPPMFVSAVVRDQVLQTQRIERGTSEVTFRIPTEQLLQLGATVIFDPVSAHDGRVIVDPRVGMSTTHSVWLGGANVENGRVVLHYETFGQRDLWVRASGHAPLHLRLELDPGEVHDLGILELQPRIQLSGKASGADGSPVECYFYLWPLEALGVGREMATQAVFHGTDEEGGFTLPMAPGRWVVVARPKEGTHGLTASLVDVAEEESPQPLTLEFPPAVSVTLSPELEEAALLRILDGRGLPLFSEWTTSREHVVALAAGSFTVQLCRADRLVREIPFEVADRDVVVDIVE